MSLEQRAQILTAITSTTYGVRDLAQKLKWKTSNAVSLLKKMNEEQLVELKQVPHSKRGRPKKSIECTPLGFEFLATYSKLKMTPLKSRKQDLERANKLECSLFCKPFKLRERARFVVQETIGSFKRSCKPNFRRSFLGAK